MQTTDKMPAGLKTAMHAKVKPDARADALPFEATIEWEGATLGYVLRLAARTLVIDAQNAWRNLDAGKRTDASRKVVVRAVEREENQRQPARSDAEKALLALAKLSPEARKAAIAAASKLS